MNDLLLTFTKFNGKYSSKKIERFICFSLAIAMLTSYYTISILGCKIIEICKITTSDVIMLSGVMLAYGGYNTTQIAKEIGK